MYIIGPLSSVGHLSISLSSMVVSLDWVAPFSLTSNTISYHFKIVNFTSSSLLLSGEITATEFRYPLVLDGIGCHDQVFTVTPVNEAGNGQQDTIFFSQAFHGRS